jgi:hypothetical protein
LGDFRGPKNPPKNKIRASPYRMEKEKNLGLFFFLAKCFQSMPKKEKFSQKKSERAQ